MGIFLGARGQNTPLRQKRLRLPHNLGFYLPFLLIASGIFFRLSFYLYNRSLWHDEVCLASNIINRTWQGLLLPLEFGQGAPLGFLFVQKFITNILGTSEAALRLFPFLCGIASIIIFYKFAKSVLNTNGVLVALGLFAINKYLIYYSAENKQYSSDVLISISLLFFILEIRRKSFTFSNSLYLGIFGAVLLWFSHPATFILSGISLSLLLIEFDQKNFQEIKKVLLFSILGFASFLCFYVFSVQHLPQYKFPLSFTELAFVPFPPRTLTDARWFFMFPFNLIKTPGGLSLTGLAVFLVFVGAYSFLKEDKELFLLLTAPILMTLLASALHQFPIYGRTCLFLTPIILILIGKGSQKLLEIFNKRYRFLSISLLLILFLNPTFSVLLNFFKPPTSGIKPLLEYINRNKKKGDVIFVYNHGVIVFNYYKSKYGIKDGDYFLGTEENGLLCSKEINKLHIIKRLWVLILQCDEFDEKAILHYLDETRTQKGSMKKPGSTSMLVHDWVGNSVVYLYELKEGRPHQETGNP